MNKTQALCKREKFPEHLPDGTNHSSMETLDMKTEPSKKKAIDEEALFCYTKNQILTPIRLSQDPCCSSLINVPVTITESSR